MDIHNCAKKVLETSIHFEAAASSSVDNEEAAASKRLEVLSTFSRNYEYPLSFLIE